MNDSDENEIEESGGSDKYYGKYRGFVINNIDPMFLGRIQVLVPDVSNIMPTSWAMPCVPVGWKQMGILSVPPIGSLVWVEFEQGDPDYPIWTGCFWGNPAEVPMMSKVLAMPPMPGITLQVANNSVVLNSTGVYLQSGPAPGTPGIIITAAGIIIHDGKGGMITLAAGVVTINQGALVIK